MITNRDENKATKALTIVFNILLIIYIIINKYYTKHLQTKIIYVHCTKNNTHIMYV